MWKKYAELIIELINTKKHVPIVDWIYSEIDDESNTYSTNGITRNLLFKPHLPSRRKKKNTILNHQIDENLKTF